MRICVIDSFYWYIGRQRIDDMQTFDRKSFFCQENSSFIIYYHNAKKHKYKRITEAYIRLQFSTGIFIIIYCSELKSQKIEVINIALLNIHQELRISTLFE